MSAFIAGHYTSPYHGTINNGGTISNELQVGDFNQFGLYGVFSVPGTLTFEVRPDTSFDKATLKDGANTAISVTVNGTTAISGEVLKPLAPYNYVTISVSPAQSSGAFFKLIGKA
jgi:hypothetical protein